MAVTSETDGELQAAVQTYSLTKRRILDNFVLKRDTLIEHLPEKMIFNNFTDISDIMVIV